MTHPYEKTPPEQFWRSGVVEADRSVFPGLYAPEPRLSVDHGVAVFGGPTVRGLATQWRAAGGQVIEAEPTPTGVGSWLADRFGYGQYSARTGPILTPRQMRELIEDAFAAEVHPTLFGEKDGRIYDLSRVTVEPDGFDRPEEAVEMRYEHLIKLAGVFQVCDVMVLSLSQAEAWVEPETGRCLGTGVFAAGPELLPEDVERVRFSAAEVAADLTAIHKLLRQNNPDVELIVMVDPVPMTETHLPGHVLQANTRGKSLLRAAAGEQAARRGSVSYFPAFDLATSWSVAEGAFAEDLVTVTPEMAAQLGQLFCAAHGLTAAQTSQASKALAPGAEDDPLICEEALLEAFRS